MLETCQAAFLNINEWPCQTTTLKVPRPLHCIRFLVNTFLRANGLDHPSGSLYNHNSLTSSSSLGRFSLDFRSWGGSHLKGLKIRNVAMPLPVAPADVVWFGGFGVGVETTASSLAPSWDSTWVRGPERSQGTDLHILYRKQTGRKPHTQKLKRNTLPVTSVCAEVVWLCGLGAGVVATASSLAPP